MTYFEATVTILLKKQIGKKDVQEQIGKFINLSMLQDESLSSFHENNGFKYYVFSGLWPIEQSKTYTPGNVYIFRIRSIKSSLLESLSFCMRQSNSDVFKVLAIEKKQFTPRTIQELYTLTPFCVSIEGNPWMSDQHDFDVLLKSLQGNAEKKYKSLFGEEVFPNTFIQSIYLLNEKPFSMHYKNITILGHKARIIVNEDEQSQKLAAIVLGTGLAEKNSALGTGFCHAKFL